MKKALSILGALLLSAGVCLAQTSPSIAFLGQKTTLVHNAGGLFLAPGYATWQATILVGAASGAQTITVTCNSGGVVGVCSLADGYSVPLTSIFNTSTPLTIMDGNQETVTPSAVTGPVSCPGGFLEVGAGTQCMQVTATFGNAHGASAPIVSGDAGVEEAITDVGANGGGLVFWEVDTGVATLTTGGTTSSFATKVPTNFYNAGAAGKITTTITGAAGNWEVGISGAATIFCTADGTLTSGTTCVANQASPASTGTSSALTAIVLTSTSGNITGGAVKMRVWGFTPVQATN